MGFVVVILDDGCMTCTASSSGSRRRSSTQLNSRNCTTDPNGAHHNAGKSVAYGPPNASVATDSHRRPLREPKDKEFVLVAYYFEQALLILGFNFSDCGVCP